MKLFHRCKNNLDKNGIGTVCGEKNEKQTIPKPDPPSLNDITEETQKSSPPCLWAEGPCERSCAFYPCCEYAVLSD